MTSPALRTAVAAAALALLCAPVAAWRWLANGPLPSPDGPGSPCVAAPSAPLAAANDDHAPTGAAAGRLTASFAVVPGVHGRVVRDGRPLAGVVVTARAVGESTASGEACTAGDGTFALALPAGRHAFAVSGNGVVRGFRTAPVQLADGVRHALGDLVVPQGGSVIGRVVDQDERPLADALVLVKGPGLPSVTADVLDPASVPGAVFARTGADGRFAFVDLPPGEVQVHAEHRLHFGVSVDIDVAVGGQHSSGDLVLTAWQALRGVVVDGAGRPLAGARVVPGGSRYSPLQVRRTVTSRADGSFELPCFGRSGDVTVSADGCQPHLGDVDNERGDVVRFVLSPALAVHGRVDGTGGRPGWVTVQQPAYGEVSAWVGEALCAKHPLAADGRFAVAALPPGRWLLGGEVPGVGVVPPTPFEVPLAAPLVLTLQPLAAMAVAVRVVDDLGAPVPGAEVVRGPGPARDIAAELEHAGVWFTWPSRQRATSDARGIAIVHVPAGDALRVAARSPWHRHAGVVAPADSIPPAVNITVARGAVLEGTLRDAALTAHVPLVVSCTALPGAGGEGGGGGSAPVGCDGHFRSGPLRPGMAHVQVVCAPVDARDGVASPAPLPWLGAWERAAPVAVELRPGATTVVTLSAPQPGEITGRVLVRGQPLADAIVFARPPLANVERWSRRHHDDADFHPHCRTDRAGRFRFLVGGAGTWELLARHALGGANGAPTVVTLQRDGERRDVDLVLPAAAIRGTFDLTQLAPRERGGLQAQLYPLVIAHEDAFWFGEWTGSLQYRMPAQPTGRTGAFAFEGLPPGGWLLRLVAGHDRVLLHHVVHVVADEVHDLGSLQVTTSHPIRVATGVAADIAVHLLAVDVRHEAGVFLATVAAADGAFDLGALAPGRYVLRPFRIDALYTMGSIGMRGDPVGAPVTIEVTADGRVQPDAAWPDGVK